MTLGSRSFFHMQRYFRKGGLSVRKMTPIKKYTHLFAIHPSGTFPILQSRGSGLLELYFYIPQVTSCIPSLWRPPKEKT